jgi:hypothetical protein
MFFIPISVYSFLLIFIFCVYLCRLKRKDSSSRHCCVNTIWGACINRRTAEQRHSVEVFAFWSGNVSDSLYQNYRRCSLPINWKNVFSIFMLLIRYCFWSHLSWYIRLTWFWEGQSKKILPPSLAVTFFMAFRKQTVQIPFKNSTRKLF